MIEVLTMATKIVENVDDEVWNKLAGLAKMKGKKVGEFLTEVIKKEVD